MPNNYSCADLFWAPPVTGRAVVLLCTTSAGDLSAYPFLHVLHIGCVPVCGSVAVDIQMFST